MVASRSKQRRTLRLLIATVIAASPAIVSPPEVVAQEVRQNPFAGPAIAASKQFSRFNTASESTGVAHAQLLPPSTIDSEPSSVSAQPTIASGTRGSKVAGPASPDVAISSVFVGPGSDGFEPMEVLPMASSRPARLPSAVAPKIASRRSPNSYRAAVDRANANPQRSQPTTSGGASKLLGRGMPTPASQQQDRLTHSGVYLATQTAKSQHAAASRLFQQAEQEYHSGAFASAEASAWQSLQKAAESIDLANRQMQTQPARSHAGSVGTSSAVGRLSSGRTAIVEAQDFVGPYAKDGKLSIARLARAHQTTVVRDTLPPTSEAVEASLPSANEAVDRYLDYARMQLSSLASQSALAAQTMDLVAAIRLGRADVGQLPGPTAICLRRAAVQGQSGNPDLVAKLGHHLADVGLVEEARWALQHSLAMRPDQATATRLAALQQQPLGHAGSSIVATSRPVAPRQPDVFQLAPEQFAAISRSVIPGSPTDATSSQPSRSNALGADEVSPSVTTASARTAARFDTAAYRKSLQTTTPQNGIHDASQTTRDASPSIPAVDSTTTRSRFLPVLKKWW